MNTCNQKTEINVAYQWQLQQKREVKLPEATGHYSTYYESVQGELVSWQVQFGELISLLPDFYVSLTSLHPFPRLTPIDA